MPKDQTMNPTRLRLDDLETRMTALEGQPRPIEPVIVTYDMIEAGVDAYRKARDAELSERHIIREVIQAAIDAMGERA